MKIVSYMHRKENSIVKIVLSGLLFMGNNNALQIKYTDPVKP